MKNKIQELDVDIIGGLGQLKEEESKLLSEYFARQKATKANELAKMWQYIIVAIMVEFFLSIPTKSQFTRSPDHQIKKAPNQRQESNPYKQPKLNMFFLASMLRWSIIGKPD
jgi:hypothetical protein